ncbi:type I phosphatidylinositol 4,5-bisphosphate 4-phosphatase-B-like [Antennarius striatus]|uniref:type I phosphatidylinositol 4,5-bisphosphate 4-phosphatase-B-like n=1 Tax=Antennarius striatus TaxID=241820 RepID=UPI0035B1A386
MADGEETPLLSEQHDGSSGLSPGNIPYLESLPNSVAPGEPPPPYSPQGNSASSSTPVVCCRVCHNTISLVGKTHQSVVKCSICNEATPIKNAPFGKKYVRCPCNCLLICKVTSQLIACPRPSCERIINLRTTYTENRSIGAHPQPVPVYIRVICGHCFHAFLWKKVCPRIFLRCPHCRKFSSVDRRYPKRRGLMWFLIFVITFGIYAGFMAGTFNSAMANPIMFALWVLFFLPPLLALRRTFIWCCMKISYPVSNIT